MATYRNVIVNRLRPAEKVDKSVKGSQLATNDFFAFNVTWKIHAFNIVDGDNAASSAASTTAQSSMGTYFPGGEKKSIRLFISTCDDL